MKKILLLLTVLFCNILVFGQIEIAKKYASVINVSGLKKHLNVIASDAMEGRETGTEGQRKAADYIQSQFQEIGLMYPEALKGYQQFFPIEQDSVSETNLLIGKEKLIFGSDFIAPVTMNENSSFSGTQVVFVGYGIEDEKYSDYANIDVKDKVVVFLNGEPRENNLYIISGKEKASNWSRYGLIKKLETAYMKGAAGALYINTSQETFTPQIIVNSQKASTFERKTTEGKHKINVATINHYIAKKIFGAAFDDIIIKGKSEIRLSDYHIEKTISVNFNLTKISTAKASSNVIGVIEGSDKKDEFVFLTAHYDHLGNQAGIIYNGADDDGSGTVTVIQMAEAFAKAKKEGHGPRRTVVFMTVSGEEKGLWGSEYYSDNPIYPLEKTSVDLNTDMIGRIDTERKKSDTAKYMYVVGRNKISSELPAILDNVNNNSTQLVLDKKFDNPDDPNRIYYRSDHYNFARKGVPILFFYDGMLKADYHKPTDDFDKIEWPLFEKRAQLIFYTAWEIANKNEMLKRDIPLDNN
jgi:Zn-dependent M28 family amino/carboxypeptidase